MDDIKAHMHQGSSPRMRGSPQLDNDAFRALRIIPADAGLTTTCTTATWTSRDHPRGCGAHSVQHHLGTSSPGSSPRVRGSRREIRQVIILPGIIPAGAELTVSTRSASGRPWDHPRGCGAHLSLEIWPFNA